MPGNPALVRTTVETGVGDVARTQSRCGALTEKGTRCRRLAYTIEKRKEAERKAKTRKRRK